MNTACIIPVRGGSKGIPRKNLAILPGGASLLEWTIDQALRCFPRKDVLVSTEDNEMAAVADRRGANVVARPPELAQDESTTSAVVSDLFNRIDSDTASRRYGRIVILQVTSPLREDEDIERGKAMMDSGAFDSVVSAFEVIGTHPAKMYYLDGDVATSVSPEFESARRQNLPKVYCRNGALFVVNRDYFEATGKLWGGRAGIVAMPRDRSIDIDNSADLERVREYLRCR